MHESYYLYFYHCCNFYFFSFALAIISSFTILSTKQKHANDRVNLIKMTLQFYRNFNFCFGILETITILFNHFYSEI